MIPMLATGIGTRPTFASLGTISRQGPRAVRAVLSALDNRSAIALVFALRRSVWPECSSRSDSARLKLSTALRIAIEHG